MVKMTVNGVFIECKKIRYQVSYQIEFITQIALYKQHVLLIQMSTPLSIMVVFGVNDIKPARHLNRTTLKSIMSEYSSLCYTLF